MDTTDPMVPPGSLVPDPVPADYGWRRESTDDPAGPTWEPPPPPPAFPPPRRRPWVVVLAVLGILSLVVGIGGALIHVPYDTIAPGSARRVDDLIKVEGHNTYPPKGKVLFTTVSVRDGISLWEALAGWIDPNVDVVPAKDLRGPISPNQYHRQNVEAMSDSKTAAEAVVLRQLGYNDLGAGAEVVSVDSHLPVASVLQPKDVIVAIDGQPTPTSAAAVSRIRAHQPGDAVRLGVVRGDAPPEERTTTLGRGDQGQALLGVQLSTKIKLPFGITIDSGNVEGPSAGLAYAIALLDDLTPGEITGGAKVAATGELAPDGVVGAIGGVAQKVVAVERAGGKMFLVPRADFAEAKAHADSHVKVVAVDTFDDALRALAQLPGSNAGDYVRPAAG